MAHSTSKHLLATLTLMVLATVASAADLRPGEAVLGSIGDGTAQSFTLDCARGDTIKITMKAKGPGEFAPDVTVLDPSGETVTARRGSRKMKVSFTAAQSGEYTVQVAAHAASSGRYQMKVKGESRRTHAAAAAEIVFGAPAGAEVRFKARGAHTAQMRRLSDNAQVDLLQAGSRYRSAVLARTDEYRIEAPGASKIKVKVAYPDARDALVVAGPGSRYDAPAASAPAGGNDVADSNDPAAPQDQGNEGEVTDPANDGTAGNGNGGNGTVAAPAPAADHGYLVELLRAEDDADVQKARVEMSAAEEQAPVDVAAEIASRFGDPVAQDLAEALDALDDQMMNAEARDYALDIVAASRRIERAHRRLAEIENQRAGSALIGDAAYDAGLAALAAAVADAEAAVAEALASGLAQKVRGEAAPALDAPAAAAATAEQHVGLAALDAAVASGLMTRARQGEAAAREALEILSAAYGRALEASPAIDANPAATRAMLDQRQGELAALAEQQADFELAAEPMAAPQAGQDYEIVIRALGANGLAMDWSVSGAEHQAQVEANGLRLMIAGHADERVLEIRAELAGQMKTVQIHIAPQARNDAPAASLAGEITVADGQPRENLPVAILIDDEVVADAQTDADGRFEIAGVNAGDAVLRIGDVEMPIHIAPGHQDLGSIHFE